MGYRGKEAAHHQLARLSYKDYDAMELLGKVCHVDEDTLLDYISNNRINTYLNEGIIERCSDPNYSDVFRTTAYGKEFIEDNLGIGCYSSNSPAHDEKLRDLYLSLSEEEQDSWRTERELSREYCDTEYSVTDGAYVCQDTGELICVEIVTVNYDGSEGHDMFAESIGASYHEY